MLMLQTKPCMRSNASACYARLSVDKFALNLDALQAQTQACNDQCSSCLLVLMPLDVPPHCLQLCVVQILVAGGTSEYCANTKSPANNQSYLIDVSLHCSELLKVLMLE